VAANKKTPSYDLNAQNRKRDLFVKLGLTTLVIAFAVGLVLYIVMGSEKKAGAGDVQAVRIASAEVIKKKDSDEPKAVISIYEDFQCPHCADFEKKFGPTLAKIAKSGAAAVDYNMLAILNKISGGYSERAANAAYCVADENKEAFERFHSALFVQQPEEGSGSGPDNDRLIETARQAGVVGSVPDCIRNNKYGDMVKGLAAASKVTSTPTIRLNGEDISVATPEELIAKVTQVVGPVPALAPTPAPAPAPAPAS